MLRLRSQIQFLMCFKCLEILLCALILEAFYYCAHKVFAKSLHLKWIGDEICEVPEEVVIMREVCEHSSVFWFNFALASLLSSSMLFLDCLGYSIWLVAFGFLSQLGIGGHLFFNFGTLVLLLHGTFGVQFVQHMTSFHCKLWPFLALFLLDIIIDFGYPYSSCLVLLFMMVKLC
ncbi:transmembrane protein, putative [Medicago truncatula]|uniref:Transmembrane protein, putative n=1 Tax=Medicago truncatula TaxID=3880 RepID=A0A072VF95_MEDTR|nr:transmembrane protein, putative [Medicago truncatula]